MPSPIGSTEPTQRSLSSSSAFSLRAASSDSGLHCGGPLAPRHLAAHQQVVDHEQRPRRQLRLGQLDVVPVLALRRVHEQQVEGALEPLDRLARVALHYLHAVRDARPAEEVARLRGALGVQLQGDHAAALELLGHVQSRVADRGAHLEHDRVERAAERGQEATGLPVHDRHAVAVGEGLHLGHHLGAGRLQTAQVIPDALVEDRHAWRLLLATASLQQGRLLKGLSSLRAGFGTFSPKSLCSSSGHRPRRRPGRYSSASLRPGYVPRDASATAPTRSQPWPMCAVRAASCALELR